MNKKTAQFFRQAALWLFILTLVLLTVCAAGLMADDQFSNKGHGQRVVLVKEALLPSLAVSFCVLAVFMLVHGAIERLGGIRLSTALLGLWLVAALAWVLMVRLEQRADALTVLQKSIEFAHNDFSAMDYEVMDYFNIFTYQLGLSLPLELLARMFSNADLNVLAQCINAALGAAGAGVLAAFAQEMMGERRAATACMMLYIVSLPTLFNVTLVYSINLMILLCGGAMLGFARYVHTGKNRFGVLYMVCMGLAVVSRPNAAIVEIALVICALLYGLHEKNIRIVGFAIGSVLLGKALFSALVAWNEMRSGVTFRYDLTMISRLAMGTQESDIAAGWYNGYIEMTNDAGMTLEKEKARALADLMERLAWMRENPAQAVSFYREKLLTVWLEPAYETLWRTGACQKLGKMNGLANAISRDETALKHVILGYMNAAQTVIYALATLGGIRALKKREDMIQPILPIVVLGGAVYHLLFEAKAQYAYPYMVYMLPLAAWGLCTVEDAVFRGRVGLNEKAKRKE